MEDNFIFEPASTIKIAVAIYAMRKVQAGAVSLDTQVTSYAPPVSSSCPGNTPIGTESIQTAIAGWAQIPFCSGSTLVSRQFVFGIFIYNSTSDATSSNTFNSTKAELLRVIK